jgi:predicted ATPase
LEFTLNYLHQEAFNHSLHEYLRAHDRFQKELAEAIGLHPKVLSRKLRGNADARLTEQDIRNIITQLAEWKVITTQDEAIHLLELSRLDASSFSEDMWHTSPLNQLARSDAMGLIRPDEPTISTYPMYPPAHSDYILSRHLQNHLLTPLTRLIGREQAIAQLRQLLEQDDVRLVTLAGAGGSGKTRLALQVASEVAQVFAQGVWFVSLAPVHDATLVAQSIMQALNIMPTSQISATKHLNAYLRNKRLLLILDNFEQILEAAPVVDELLQASPGLKVLVTSRAVLHLHGEHEFSVSPLDFPAAGEGVGTAQLAHYSAIQLFVEHARAVQHDFHLTDKNAADIAQICARVDGLPLALELAAARVKVLSPAQLLARLSKARLSVLTGGPRNLPDRQQTLRKTITWSYQLLSPEEQWWFARLGVFSGGWSLEAVEAMVQDMLPDVPAGQEDPPVTSAPEFALELLEHLKDTSLLVRFTALAGQLRFTLRETVREYVLEQLTAHREYERLHDWHASYYLGVAEAAERGLRGAEQRVWREQLVAEQENFRAALAWSCQQAKAETGTQQPATEVSLRLASALRSHWEWQGHIAEGRQWLETVLALPIGEGAGRSILAARAKALSETARMACLQNEEERAVALAEASIALWQQLDDATGLAIAFFYRGWVAIIMCDFALAKRVYQQGLQLVSPADAKDQWLRAQLFFYLGTTEGFSSDFEQMRACYARSKAIFEQLDDKIAIADLLKDRGGMAILEGHYEEAIAYLVQSLPLSHELGYKQYLATGMGSLGFAIGARGEPDPVSASLQTAQLWGAVESIHHSIGSSTWITKLPLAQILFIQIRSRVDDESWKTAWRKGRTLSEEEAIAFCLEIAGKRQQ